MIDYSFRSGLVKFSTSEINYQKRLLSIYDLLKTLKNIKKPSTHPIWIVNFSLLNFFFLYIDRIRRPHSFMLI